MQDHYITDLDRILAKLGEAILLCGTFFVLGFITAFIVMLCHIA
jgi:hypothetical protein